MTDALKLARELDVETLAAEFHDIYQAEAKRQGDVRHKDAYADLPENIKEFDRVLARHVLSMLNASRLEEAKWWAYSLVDYDNPGAEISAKERLAALEQRTGEQVKE